MQLRDITKTIEDAAYVGIGFGVLGFKRASSQVSSLLNLAAEQREQLDAIDLRLTPQKAARALAELGKELEDRLEPTVDSLEQRLPEQARTAVARARKIARETRAEVRNRIAGTPDAPTEAAPAAAA